MSLKAKGDAYQWMKGTFVCTNNIHILNMIYVILIECGAGTAEDLHLFASHICAGLVQLHSRDIIHRDLKPENILFYPDSQNVRFVIADFGLSRKKRRSELGSRHTVGVGTMRYAAPEIMNPDYTTAIDIFPFGLILLECAFYFLFPNANELKMNDPFWAEVAKSKKRKGNRVNPASSIKDELLFFLQSSGFPMLTSKLFGHTNQCSYADFLLLLFSSVLAQVVPLLLG